MRSGAGLTTFEGAFGSSTLGVPFNNNGIVDVQGGILQLASGSSTTGAFTIAEGATLDFFRDSYVSAGPITGSNLKVSGGTLHAIANVSVQALSIQSGTLEGAGDLTVTGAMNWTGGTMSGTGKTIITAGGTLNISGPVGRTLSRVLQNEGTATWNGTGQLLWNSGTLTNNGTFIATVGTGSTLSSMGVSGTNTFNNTGTFIMACSPKSDPEVMKV